MELKSVSVKHEPRFPPASFAAAALPHSFVSYLDSPKSREKTKWGWETCSVTKVNDLKHV